MVIIVQLLDIKQFVIMDIIVVAKIVHVTLVLMVIITILALHMIVSAGVINFQIIVPVKSSVLNVILWS
ncbi:hypothetical protein C2G38_2081023 [Gigaspora rosea]|uniref:Uncharacterized protein n=1 Tax=Gigaspora rosea TaxID=44941 RepID=A0A397VEV3_9GLOM|nr:hypothetical protein C2G38_2081023 [Gigaspora rosea]